MDVGASSQIRGELLKLRDTGCGVLVVSEELDELFEICDRLYVMAKGQMSPSLSRAEATVEQVGLWMSGLWSENPVPTAASGLDAAAGVDAPGGVVTGAAHLNNGGAHGAA